LNRLPPLTSLRYFEAAARLGSFSAAASELHVSNGAVSYHIHSLERFLQKPLFIRRIRRVSLTEDGQQLHAVVSVVLPQIASVAASITHGARQHDLSVQVGPYFSAQWLSPRLGEFHRLYPNIALHLHHVTTRRFEEKAQFDLSILWGTGTWRGCEAQLLLPVEGVPVCSPAYKRKHSGLERLIETGSARLTFLHYDGHDAWAEWYRGMGVRAPTSIRAPALDEPNILNEAAVSGQGVAIGFLPLVAKDLRTKRLTAAHSRRVPSVHGYYLVYRRGNDWSNAARQFVQWIQPHIKATLEDLAGAATRRLRKRPKPHGTPSA
jgi:LysR family transcriptional regulator, glycine cleavage system transcriptional activator